jgi:hypothetical protein
MEEAVNHEGSSSLVHLILDWLPADRNLNNDIYIVRGTISYRNSIETHCDYPQLALMESAIDQSNIAETINCYPKLQHLHV